VIYEQRAPRNGVVVSGFCCTIGACWIRSFSNAYRSLIGFVKTGAPAGLNYNVFE
jgi:hypothetical protein